MASLHSICPQTHRKVFTGVETGAQSLRASWKTTLKVDCPYCVAVHEIAVREAYLDSAIHAATDRLSVFSSHGPLQTFSESGRRKELPLRAKLVPTDERRRRIVKKPNWLSLESSETKSDHLKKVRRHTDQKMKQQEAQKEERDNDQSRSIGSAIDRPAR
jgi:hypothetical protein